MKDTNVLVSIKNVYGNEMVYPANEVAQTFAKLTGKKTFSAWDISQIKALGYTVTVTIPTL